MHNDAVDLVTIDHADVEESGVFAVERVMHDAALAVAVVLRRLHDADLGIGEGRHEVLEPVELHNVVGVQNADDLRVRRGVVESQPQCARLEALELILADELETITE